MQLADFGPLATGIAAVVAFVVGISTIRQKAAADRRDQWWKRAQWAIDRTLSKDERQREIGYDILRLLADSALAGPDELLILRSVSRNELGETSDIAPSVSTGDPEVDTEGDADGR